MLKNHIARHFPDVHPDEVKDALAELGSLRSQVVPAPSTGTEVHTSLLHSLLM